MRAKILSETELSRVLDHARPMMRVAVLASFRAGLRSKELAALDWAMVTNASGGIADFIDLPAVATKGSLGAGRVPMMADMKDALLRLWHERRRPLSGPVLCDDRLGRLTANAVRFRLKSLYKKAGLQGVSSHSGRRTLGTRLASDPEINLSSVQAVLRHARPSTTLLYVDAESDPAIREAMERTAC